MVRGSGVGGHSSYLVDTQPWCTGPSKSRVWGGVIIHKASNTPNIGVQGPKYHNLNALWHPKPYDLGTWSLGDG